MTAPVRFATVGVLQNGLNVAVFALATAVGVQCRVAAGPPPSTGTGRCPP